MTTKISKLALQSFFLGVILATPVLSRVPYGGECSLELRCDASKFLSCSKNSSKCDCLMPGSMTFDHMRDQCVSLAGERCEYTTTTGEGTRTWNDQVTCVAKSECKNGVCECESDYYELSNGTCVQKLGYGEECQGNKMCRNSSHLICGDEKKCACQSNWVMANETIGKCEIMAGKPCTYGDKCTENSYCNQGRCFCNTGYFPADNGTCQPKRSAGEPCQNSENCKDKLTVGLYTFPTFLTCLNETCACDPEKAQESQTVDGTKFCGKGIGITCNRWGGDICISGAICNRSLSTCQCDQTTYFETSEKTCEEKRNFNQPCNTISQCNYASDKLICSETSRTCQCEDNAVVDPDTKACKLKVNSVCFPYSSNLCVNNAKCRYYNDKFRCRCDDDFESSSTLNDYCYINEGEPCFGDLKSPVTTKTCLPGLLCRNKTCTCPYLGQQVYNKSLELCKSHVAGPCTASKDCHDPQAECTKKIPEEGLQCHCKSGYVGVGTQCKIGYGGRCDQRNEGLPCDSVAPLICGSGGTCECADLQMYDKDKQVCERLVGSRCDAERHGNPGACVTGAFCEKIRGFENAVGVCACELGKKMLEDRTCGSME